MNRIQGPTKIIDNGSMEDTLTSNVFDIRSLNRVSLQIVYTALSVSAKAFASGTAEVQTLTFDTFANTNDGDYVILEDTDANQYAVALDKTGSTVPSGAKWAAIDAANKAIADISSGVTTAAEVAAAAETALNTISGFSSIITTDDTAADGTMQLTWTESGPVADPDPEAEDDGGPGSISGVEDTAGVAGDVGVASNEITETAHGYVTGLLGQMTTSDTLPGGLSTSTDYYIIVVDANTYKLATSKANADAGTAIDITSIGVGNQTFTPTTFGGSFDLQGSVDFSRDPSGATKNAGTWTSIPLSPTISASGSSGNDLIDITAISMPFIRMVYTPTGGSGTLNVWLSGK